MNRMWKNIISVSVIVVMLVLAVFTVKSMNSAPKGFDKKNFKIENRNGDNKMQTPSDFKQDNSQSDSKNDSSDNKMQAPDFNGDNSKISAPPNAGNGFRGGRFSGPGRNNVLNLILLFMEGLVAGAAATYLIITKASKKNFKNSLKTHKKIIISSLITVAVGISFLAVGLLLPKSNVKMPPNINQSINNSKTNDKTDTATNDSNDVTNDTDNNAAGDNVQ